MNYFTTRNVIILALVEMGICTLGVLAAAVSLKWHADFRVFQPTGMKYLAAYGWFAMLLPAGWAITALHILRRKEGSEGAKVLAVLAGVLLLAALLLLLWQAVGREWLRLGLL
jgi:hypothetical protein